MATRNNYSEPPPRVPPHNIEAEMAVLGAMLLGDKGAVGEAALLLSGDDFYRHAHALIFQAMCDLSEKGEPVDAVTLKDELKQRGVLEGIGGVVYITHLADVAFTTANLPHYAEIVRAKSVLRGLIEAASLIAGKAYADSDSQTPTEIIEQAESLLNALAERGGRGKDNFVPLPPLIDAELTQAEDRGKASGILGIPSGFAALDTMTGGWQNGDLIILAARPSMGKTACAIQMGIEAAKAGYHVAVFSLEMSKELLNQRILCAESLVPSQLLRTGQLTEKHWADLRGASERLWEIPFRIDDKSDLHVSELQGRCRRLKNQWGQMDLIIVDYLQQLRGESGRVYESKNVETTQIAQGLKRLAREFKVPVIALAQLSRNVERRDDKRPQLSDLRDSGAIEAEADVVAFLYRAAYYERKEAAGEPDTGNPFAPPDAFAASELQETELIIAKQRNGPTGLVRLGFRPVFVRFENLDTRHGEGF